MKRFSNNPVAAPEVQFARSAVAYVPYHRPTDETIIPADFPITKCSARVAVGAKHRSVAPRGDGPSDYQAARQTGAIAALADRRGLLAYASRSPRRK